MAWGLARRRRKSLHTLGIDEVSRCKGHHYLIVVYDLEHRVLLWVGKDRTEEALAPSFTELGPRRAATIRVVCFDMWHAHLNAVRNYAPNA